MRRASYAMYGKTAGTTSVERKSNERTSNRDSGDRISGAAGRERYPAAASAAETDTAAHGSHARSRPDARAAT